MAREPYPSLGLRARVGSAGVPEKPMQTLSQAPSGLPVRCFWEAEGSDLGTGTVIRKTGPAPRPPTPIQCRS